MTDDDQGADGDVTLPAIPTVRPRERSITESISAVQAGELGPEWLKAQQSMESSSRAEETGARHPPPPRPPHPPPPRKERWSEPGAANAGQNNLEPLARSWDGASGSDLPPLPPSPLWSTELGKTRPGPPVRPPNPLRNPVPLARPSSKPPPPKRASEPATDRARRPARTVTDLLWFDRAALPRLRKSPAFRELLLAVEVREPDPELDDVTLGATPAEVEDRRDIFEILTVAEPVDRAGIEQALSDAIREDGKLVPPLVLTEGALRLPFDPLATLEAELALVKPLAATDDKLKAEIAFIVDYLAAADLEAAPQMVDMLSRRLWDAFGRTRRMISAETLKRQAEMALLRKRRYQSRDLFGAPHLRAWLRDDTDAETLVYLPAAMTTKLPLFMTFRARVVGVAHVAVDEGETEALALRGVALARRVRRGGDGDWVAAP